MPEETPPKKHSFFRRFLFFLKFLEIRLRFIFILVVTALVVGYWDYIQNYYERYQREHNPAAVQEAHEQAAESEYQYICPMHPFVVRDHPDKCPICGMDLVQRKKGEAQELPEGAISRVQASPERVMQAGIQVEPVDYHELEYQIESYGVVAIDETRRARIVARFPGHVDELMVTAVGMMVKKGEPIVRMHSPKFLAASDEYLHALNSQRKMEETSRTPEDKARAEQLADAAKKRLMLAGFADEQLEMLAKNGAPKDTITLYSPLSGTVIEKNILLGDSVEESTPICTIADLSTLWVDVKVLEADIAAVKKGMPVKMMSVAYPGETFDATVDLITPVLDSDNRTATVRVVVANPDNKLKPGMYMTAIMSYPAGGVAAPHHEHKDQKPNGKLKLPTTVQDDADKYLASLPSGAEYYVCPMHPNVVSDKADDCPLCHMKLDKKTKESETASPKNGILSIPETAVIDTGDRRIVYVESAPGVYDAHAVTLGRRSGEYYPVLEGLTAGQKVVAKGSFLIDAEARLNPATKKN